MDSFLDLAHSALEPVKVGDRIAAGQTVLVLEAMKMQEQIGAPAAGMVPTREM